MSPEYGNDFQQLARDVLDIGTFWQMAKVVTTSPAVNMSRASRVIEIWAGEIGEID